MGIYINRAENNKENFRFRFFKSKQSVQREINVLLAKEMKKFLLFGTSIEEVFSAENVKSLRKDIIRENKKSVVLSSAVRSEELNQIIHEHRPR